MPDYYYEYMVPNDEMEALDPDERRERRADPTLYRVATAGTLYAQEEHTAASMVDDAIANVFPAYKEYNYGIAMFTEVPDDVSDPNRASIFTDEDWRERLERAVKDPDSTITISEDERNLP